VLPAAGLAALAADAAPAAPVLPPELRTCDMVAAWMAAAAAGNATVQLTAAASNASASGASDAATYACRGCSPGFYMRAPGQCAICPAPPPRASLAGALPALRLAGILLGIGAIVAALVYATQRGRGGTLTGGIRRASGFLLWAVALLQVVAQIGRAAPAQLPAAILAFYSAVAVLRFSGAIAGTVPPACTWDSPFGKDEAMMAAALALLAVLAAWSIAAAGLCCGRNGRAAAPASCRVRWCLSDSSTALPKRAPAARAPAGSAHRLASLCVRLALVGLGVLYSPVSSAALALLDCRAVSLRYSGYLLLDSDGLLPPPPAGSDPLVAVTVLSSLPFNVCWQGQHAAAGVLAALTLALYLALWPVATLLLLRHAYATALDRAGALSRAGWQRAAALDRAAQAHYIEAGGGSPRRGGALLPARSCIRRFGRWLAVTACGAGKPASALTQHTGKASSVQSGGGLHGSHDGALGRTRSWAPRALFSRAGDTAARDSRASVVGRASIFKATPHAVAPLADRPEPRTRPSLASMSQGRRRKASASEFMALQPHGVAATEQDYKHTPIVRTSDKPGGLEVRLRTDAATINPLAAPQVGCLGGLHTAHLVERGGRPLQHSHVGAARASLTAPVPRLQSVLAPASAQAAVGLEEYLNQLPPPAPLQADPVLSAYAAGELKAARSFFRHVDHGLLLCLAALVVFEEPPADTVHAVGKVFGCCAATWLVATMTAAQRPYVSGWQTLLRVAALIVSSLGSILNFLGWQLRERQMQGADTTQLDAAVLGFSYCVFAACIALFLALLLALLHILQEGATRERLRDLEAAEAHAALVRSRRVSRSKVVGGEIALSQYRSLTLASAVAKGSSRRILSAADCSTDQPTVRAPSTPRSRQGSFTGRSTFERTMVRK
jgi:hypothetical protein